MKAGPSRHILVNMKTFRMIAALWLVPALLAACEQAQQPDAEQPGLQTARPVARPEGAVSAPAQNARTAEQFDTTSNEQRAAALTQDSGGDGLRELGRTIASLGAPARPGFWLETPLVATEQKGRVVYPANGKAVSVDLLPLEGPQGGGSRISLPAMRLLGISLTDLPELVVNGR